MIEFAGFADTQRERCRALRAVLARGDIGVKWREVLVIEGGDASWLDEDVPHQR